MVSSFIGREQQLSTLYRLLAQVAGHEGPLPGRAVVIRGRRRVGKSRLVEEFLARAVVPHVYLSPSTRFGPDLSRPFVEQVLALAPDEPGVVVLDDVAGLAASDPGFEAVLQKLADLLA